MPNLKRRSVLATSAAAFAAAAKPHWSLAQNAPYGPDDLKSTLTPFGAIRAGNTDGTIPAWTGGYSTVSPGYQQGDMRADPFAGEKPLFSITDGNALQYQNKLPIGVMALLQKYPDFRLDVYPTHRTARSRRNMFMIISIKMPQPLSSRPTATPYPAPMAASHSRSR